MADYLKPMLDVGSPRVFNCNMITRRLQAAHPEAETFFRNKPMNSLVLIKDTVPDDGQPGYRPPVGTKLYFPFNEKDIYSGGRTIFVHDKNIEKALLNHFGDGALRRDALMEDMKILRLLDRMPSLDPFLLKDVFLNEDIKINQAYFEVSEEVWKEIELFILQRFEPLVKAAFPDAMSSDEKARQLIEKIWEARDLEALDPLIKALQLPKGQELEIFAAWKGINFYSFQSDKAKPMLAKLLTWLKDFQIPVAAVTAAERDTLKAMLEMTKNQIRVEWQTAESIIREYQESYDKLFKHKGGSGDFLAFLRKSNKAYWDLGNSLGKTGQAIYCWDASSQRFPDRKMPWEPMKEIVILLAKIFEAGKKPATSVAWT
jgi:hypothetical protein